MQEFRKKSAPQPEVTWARGLGEAALAKGTHRKTAHGQVFTAPSRSGPLVSSPLPPSPPPATPINRNSPGSKAGKHKQVLVGLRDAGGR